MENGHLKKEKKTMGFVPKDGDKVIINPDAMKLPLDYVPSVQHWRKQEPFVIKVRVHPYYPMNLMVAIETYPVTEIAIDTQIGAYWYAAEKLKNPPSLFLPAFDIIKAVLNKDDLKRFNTKPGRTECIQCGTPLHNIGWYSMQYCPKCEP